MLHHLTKEIVPGNIIIYKLRIVVQLVTNCICSKPTTQIAKTVFVAFVSYTHVGETSYEQLVCTTEYLHRTVK